MEILYTLGLALVLLLLTDQVYLAFGSHCEFPVAWRGEWYKAMHGDIRIGVKAMSPHLGICHKKDEKRFMYLLKKRHNNCYICLVFTYRHNNILQFKKSHCLRDTNLSRVCGEITGDFLLHTMVRVRNTPVPCPFQGPYTFSYHNNSDPVCQNPISQVHACADESRFKFQFRRCNGIVNTYNQELDFQCLATWNSGYDHLYGKFTGPSITDKSQMYRCFLHDFQGTPGRMAMSADPSCRIVALDSSTAGFMFNKQTDKWPSATCQFPDFFVNHPKWRDLTGKYSIHIDNNRQKFKLRTSTGILDMRYPNELSSEDKYSFKCLDSVEESSTLSRFEYRTFATNDSCVSNYQCVRLHKRSENVLELYIGDPLQDRMNSCEQRHFVNSTRYVFIPSSSSPRTCPLPGNYTFTDVTSRCNGTFRIGCQNRNEMEIETECPGRRHTINIVQCLDIWKEHHNLHVIVERPRDISMKGTCLTISDSGESLTVSTQQECNFMLPQILGKRITYQLSKPAGPCEVDLTSSYSTREVDDDNHANTIRVGLGSSDDYSSSSRTLSHAITRNTFTLIVVCILYAVR